MPQPLTQLYVGRVLGSNGKYDLQETGVEQWTIDMLCFSYPITFHHQSPMTLEPKEFPFYGLGSLKAKALHAEVDTALSKGVLDTISEKSPAFCEACYRRLIICPCLHVCVALMTGTLQ